MCTCTMGHVANLSILMYAWWKDGKRFAIYAERGEKVVKLDLKETDSLLLMQ